MLNIEELTGLCSELGCRITPECSLREYITFRFGGTCRALISVNSAESAAKLLRYVRDNSIRFGILGRGSNVIVPDDGFDGVILLFGSDFAHIETNGNKMKCEAGALLASACVHAQQSGLTGMENLFGIPGTVGGALYMNAGAYGFEMKAYDVLEEDERAVVNIVEAAGDSYSHQDALSVYSGACTPVGWFVHEWMWHNDAGPVRERADYVSYFYTSGNEQFCRNFIKLYDIDYIFVGPAEVCKYPVNAEGFKNLGKVCVSEQWQGCDLMLIRVDRSKL